MSALLRAELLKLRTTRTFFALMGAALALSLLVVALVTLLQDEWLEEDVRATLTSDFTSLFILMLGIVGMAGEWRHRTITGSILAAPDRVRFTLAKLLAYAIAGMVLSLGVTLAVFALGTAILASRDLPTLGVGDLLDILWRNLLVAGLAGAIGVVIGGLVRNQVVAIVGTLVVAFAVEPTLLALAPDVGKYGPLVGAPGGITEVDFQGESGGDSLLSTPLSIVVSLAWIAAGFAAVAALLRKRDLV